MCLTRLCCDSVLDNCILWWQCIVCDDSVLSVCKKLLTVMTVYCLCVRNCWLCCTRVNSTLSRIGIIALSSGRLKQNRYNPLPICAQSISQPHCYAVTRASVNRIATQWPEHQSIALLCSDQSISQSHCYTVTQVYRYHPLHHWHWLSHPVECCILCFLKLPPVYYYRRSSPTPFFDTRLKFMGVKLLSVSALIQVRFTWLPVNTSSKLLFCQGRLFFCMTISMS